MTEHDAAERLDRLEPRPAVQWLDDLEDVGRSALRLLRQDLRGFLTDLDSTRRAVRLLWLDLRSGRR